MLSLESTGEEGVSLESDTPGFKPQVRRYLLQTLTLGFLIWKMKTMSVAEFKED